MSAVVGQDTVASFGKRKNEEESDGSGSSPPSKVTKTGEDDDLHMKPAAATKPANSKAREVRLEQNRKAARESRRRKKVMIEELQRSVIFFSRANNTLKQQNDELMRFLMQAQMQIAAIESHKESSAPAAVAGATAEVLKTEEGVTQALKTEEGVTQAQQEAQVSANAAAQQALLESKGYTATAARTAAQAMNGNDIKAEPSKDATAAAGQAQPPLPPMQPGATMQAMANFQQAAAAAMQSAMGQMQNVPGVSVSQLSAAPAGTNAQQAYTDTMTAIAMQQAAAAAAAGMMQPGGMQIIQPLVPQWQQQLTQPQESQDPKIQEDKAPEIKE